jgi:hypothetical protein
MTESVSTKISIPYPPGERSKAYEAKVQYLSMGQYRWSFTKNTEQSGLIHVEIIQDIVERCMTGFRGA